MVNLLRDKETPPEKLLDQELRAAVCREHRRGLSKKAIAGGLKITQHQVEKILEESLNNINGCTDEQYERIVHPSPLPLIEDDVEERDLALKIRDQRNLRYDTLVEQAEDRQPSPGAPVPPRDESIPTKKNPTTQVLLYADRHHSEQEYWAKRRHAFKLRKSGKDYLEIAEIIGTSPTEAQKMVRAELGQMSHDEFYERDLARRLHLERLEALLEACWAAATRQPTDEFPLQQPDLEATRTVLRILERESKLLGLDSAPKIDIEERIRIIARRNGIDEDEMVAYATESIRLRLLPEN